MAYKAPKMSAPFYHLLAPFPLVGFFFFPFFFFFFSFKYIMVQKPMTIRWHKKKKLSTSGSFLRYLLGISMNEISCRYYSQNVL